MSEALENFALADTDTAGVDTHPAIASEIAPIIEPDIPPPPPNPNVPSVSAFKTCRHCGAEYPAGVKGPCPGCGKSQAGRKAGSPARKTPAQPEAPPEPPPKTEKEMEQIEQAIGDTFAFVCEDIIAGMAMKLPKPPAFGDERAARLGAVWAPILAPYINGPFLIALVAIAISVRGLGSYFRECKAAQEALLASNKH